jgi:hypothetical protein
LSSPWVQTYERRVAPMITCTKYQISTGGSEALT